MISANKIVNFIFAITLIIILTSCATIQSYQTKCEENNSNFNSMVACLKQNLSNDKRYNSSRDSDLAHLYVAYAEKLASDIQSGKITEQEARYMLAREYVNLKSNANVRTQQTISNNLLQQSILNNSQQYNRSTTTNCYRTQFGYSCVSQ